MEWEEINGIFFQIFIWVLNINIMTLKIQKKGSIIHGEDLPLSVCMMKTQDPSCRVKWLLARSPTTISQGPALLYCPGKVLFLADCSTQESMPWTFLGNVIELTLTVVMGDRPKGMTARETVPPLARYTTRESRSWPSPGQCWRPGPGYVDMGELVQVPQLPLGPPLTWTSRSTGPDGTVQER